MKKTGYIVAITDGKYLNFIHENIRNMYIINHNNDIIYAKIFYQSTKEQIRDFLENECIFPNGIIDDKKQPRYEIKEIEILFNVKN